MKRGGRAWLLAAAALLAGCGSALTSTGGYPNVRILGDVLTPTAGPPAVVDDAWHRNAAFAVRLLAGWTAETAPAWHSPGVTFRNGPCTALTVTLRPYQPDIPDECEDQPLRFVMRGGKVNGLTVLTAAMVPVEDWPSVADDYAALAASVRAP